VGRDLPHRTASARRPRHACSPSSWPCWCHTMRRIGQHQNRTPGKPLRSYRPTRPRSRRRWCGRRRSSLVPEVQRVSFTTAFKTGTACWVWGPCRSNGSRWEPVFGLAVLSDRRKNELNIPPLTSQIKREFIEQDGGIIHVHLMSNVTLGDRQRAFGAHLDFTREAGQFKGELELGVG